MTNKIINKVKSLNRKKLLIITSIIFFPVTIIFSPIILLLLDIITKQRMIIETMEKIRTGDSSSDNIKETMESIMMLLITKNGSN